MNLGPAHCLALRAQIYLYYYYYIIIYIIIIYYWFVTRNHQT